MANSHSGVTSVLLLAPRFFCGCYSISGVIAKIWSVRFEPSAVESEVPSGSELPRLASLDCRTNEVLV